MLAEDVALSRRLADELLLAPWAADGPLAASGVLAQRVLLQLVTAKERLGAHAAAERGFRGLHSRLGTPLACCARAGVPLFVSTFLAHLAPACFCNKAPWVSDKLILPLAFGSYLWEWVTLVA